MPTKKSSERELMLEMFEQFYTEEISLQRIKWSFVFNRIIRSKTFAFEDKNVSRVIDNAIKDANIYRGTFKELAQTINQQRRSYDQCRSFARLLVSHLLTKGILSKIVIESLVSLVQIKNGELLDVQKEWNQFLRDKKLADNPL